MFEQRHIVRVFEIREPNDSTAAVTRAEAVRWIETINAEHAFPATSKRRECIRTHRPEADDNDIV